MCPSGRSESVGAPVVVVDAERLLELRRVRRLRDRDHARVDVGHVVAADDVGGVREPVRVAVVRRAQQQRRRVRRAARRRRRRRRCRSPRAPRRSTTTRVTRAPGRVGLQPLDLRVGDERDVVVLERRPHAAHVRVGLAVGQAREAVEAVAAHAAARLRVGLVEVDADRQVERLVAGRREVVVELLDARLVRDRRVRERARARRLGGVLAGLAVDEVEPLGLGVVGLEVGVVDRPRGRDAAVVLDLAEVALAQAEEDRAVDLRVAADEVLRVRTERLRRACRTSARSVT